jgi:hypothetical protein
VIENILNGVEKPDNAAIENIVEYNQNTKGVRYMWKQDTYYRNGVEIGKVWHRVGARFWKWGYTGGFVASSKSEAMRQVERM